MAIANTRGRSSSAQREGFCISHTDCCSAELLLRASRNKGRQQNARQSGVMSPGEMPPLTRRDDSRSHGQGELIVQLPELM